MVEISRGTGGRNAGYTWGQDILSSRVSVTAHWLPFKTVAAVKSHYVSARGRLCYIITQWHLHKKTHQERVKQSHRLRIMWLLLAQHLRVWINLTRKTSILLARQKKKIRLLTAECIISTKISNILHQRLCLYDLFGSTWGAKINKLLSV